MDREVDTLARTIYGEARGETQLGREAVAHVVMNRTRKGGWWGRDVISVCMAAEQFSCWNTGDPNRTPMMAASLHDPSFAQCYKAALDVLTGNSPDPTGGATHFYNYSYPTPAWARQMQEVRIGRHAFVRIKEGK